MKQPGIEVRPIEQIDGAAEFAEVFFTDARCPKDNVVGGVNNGWKVAMTTLGFERGTSATTGHRRFEKELEVIIEKAREKGRTEDPLVRQELARAWSKVQIMRINGLRTLTSVVQDRKDLGVATLGATNKMFWSEYHQQVMNLAIDVLGPEGQILSGDPELEEAVPGYGARRTSSAVPVVGAAVLVLLLALRDHLGRHVADPAQHRGRAGPGPAQGAEAGVGDPGDRAEAGVGDPGDRAEAGVGDPGDRAEAGVGDPGDRAEAGVGDPGDRAEAGVGDPGDRAEAGVGDPGDRAEAGVGDPGDRAEAA